MPFDFDAAVSAPHRMQPGLRLLAAGTRQLTPLHPHERTFKEKLAVLSCHAPQALLVAPDFDAAPALSALCHQAAREWPDAFGWDGAIASAAQLGWSVRHDTPVALGESAPSEIGACLAGLPSGWRLAGLLALAFAEDLAIVDARRGRIAWLAVCLPSHWAPEEKIGRSFAEVHAPVADNALLVKAGDALIKLVSAGERWERFVWTVTAHAHLRAHPHAHPQLLATERWPPGCDAGRVASLAHWRTEHQTFIPLKALQQAIFTIHVEQQPLATALHTPGRAAALHAALASMSDAVLAYRGLASVREPLLQWLAARAA